MAIYKSDIVDINLESGSIQRSFMKHSIGTADQAADRFGIRAFRNGEAVDLSGASCYGYFRDPQGNNIALTSNGTVDGNVAYVTLPQACYNYEGNFTLTIKLLVTGVTSTVRIIDGVVDNTNTGSAVAPTSAVPSYSEILSQYDDMVAATAVANGAIATTFNAATVYPAGSYVINSGALYRITADHAANVTWANTSKVATNFGAEVSSLKSAIDLIPVATLDNVAVSSSGNYCNLVSNTGSQVKVYEIDKYTEVTVKRPASSSVYFGVADVLYTAVDVPVSSKILAVSQSGKEYTYTNPNKRIYLYLMTVLASNASYTASISINIPTEIENMGGSKLKDEVNQIKTITNMNPVAVLQNVGVQISSSFYNLISATGAEVAIYDIRDFKKVSIKRPISSNVVFGISDGLYQEPVTDVILQVTESGQQYEYTNQNNRKYLYISTKLPSDPRYYVNVSINAPAEIAYGVNAYKSIELMKEHGEFIYPVGYINNAEVAKNGSYGKISEVTGSRVAIYKINKGFSYYIRRNGTNSVFFLISLNIYTEPTNAYISTVEKSGENEYVYDNSAGYEYLYITDVLASLSGYSAIVMTDAKDITYDLAYSIQHERPFPKNVVCTYKKMYVVNENGVLKFSSNKLKSYSKSLDVSSYGTIKTYHLFDNGCIAFFTHNKAYYSEDWETVNEATLYETDGTTPYVPSTYDNFTTTKEDKNRKYVDGQDLYVFGNYGITDEANTRRIIWGSFDNGHSYIVLYEFNISGAYTIRHVHTVSYNPNYDKFLCVCGDSNSEARVLQFEISDESMVNLEQLGSGTEHYMWAAFAFYGAEIYFCLEESPSALMKCKFTQIDDPTKHEIVLPNLPNYPIGLFVGDRGDMLVTLTRYRASDSYSVVDTKYDALKIYYSEDRKNFRMIMTDQMPGMSSFIYYGFYSPNDDGIVLSGIFNHGGISLDNWQKMPSVDLANFVKKAGYPNAFSPIDPTKETVPVISMECDDQTVAENAKIDLPTVTFFPYNAGCKQYTIIEYNSDIIHLTDDDTKILGWQPGETDVKIRANSNWEVTFTFKVTVT